MSMSDPIADMLTICILNCVPESASGFVCFLFCFYALQYNGNL